MSPRFLGASCRVVLVLGGLCGVVTAGCGRREDVTARAEASASVGLAQVSSAAPSRPNSAAAGQAKAAEDEGCFVDHNEPIRDDGATVTTDPVTGQPMTRVGAKLDGSAIAVTVSELLENPEKFAGRPVRLEGPVTAMCGHRRAWFAIVDEGTTQPPVTIVTAPNFLVPKDAVGKKARTTGTIEVREISEQAAEHQAREHGMPTARRIVTIKAQGAEFL